VAEEARKLVVIAPMLIKSHKEIKWLTNNRKEETKWLINGPMHLNNEQADYNIGQSITDWENVYSQPHPGASLLAELEQERKWVKHWHDLLEQTQDELERLRGIEAVAQKLRDSYGKDAQTKMQAWHEFKQALSQAKAGDTTK